MAALMVTITATARLAIQYGGYSPTAIPRLRVHAIITGLMKITGLLLRHPTGLQEHIHHPITVQTIRLTVRVIREAAIQAAVPAAAAAAVDPDPTGDDKIPFLICHRGNHREPIERTVT